MKKRIETFSAEETISLARKIGENLQGGEVIEFVSDIGAGKTTFVGGLVAGYGISDFVSSPSFTLKNLYKTNEKEIHHFDFYRLQEPGVVAEELREGVENPNSVIIVEWAETVHDVLPKSRIVITIDKSADKENARIINIEAPSDLYYVFSEEI